MTTGHVFIATSLDGFIAREDGDIAWLLSRDDPAEDHGYEDFIRDIDALVMGRGSYEAVCALGEWPYDRPVLVLSRRLAGTPVPPALAGRVRFADLAPREAMRQLAAEGKRRVYVDGGQVVQAFLREGLVEDLVITRIPVLLGTGRPLFGPTGGGDIALAHLGTKAFPSGLVQSRYRVVAA
ncbi:dihydrofolate reductase family protein [Pseudoroseomonas cervicalis]|uniref:dihydrofolate reductase family protein n=1 Tax=Teichococcus cervicalis TaxID=204525 RepID=UPI0022F17A6D|nr:dihydrofolate reductase family protein [Pseudoroseomonas cervicalis]WBV43547.1 dihydrofolate reductase family protein [Pseudoroseomonas cervicalis]